MASTPTALPIRLPIRLIVGLGNPGKEYTYTRHNLGFLTVGRYFETLLSSLPRPLAKTISAKSWREKFSGDFFDLSDVIDSAGSQLPPQMAPFWLLPTTYMNRSGAAVVVALKALRLQPAETLIVYDDLDIAVGSAKLKFGGGAGGHNGIISILQESGSDQFWRLRLGIGKPPANFSGNGADYVLGRMATAELEAALTVGIDSLQRLHQLTPERAMQFINSR